MKSKKVQLTRNGKKKFSIESEYDGKSPGINYHGDGSYLKQSMAETMEEAFQVLLRVFDLDKELTVTVKEKQYNPNGNSL